jgi:hypothetical protein
MLRLVNSSLPDASVSFPNSLRYHTGERELLRDGHATDFISSPPSKDSSGCLSLPNNVLFTRPTHAYQRAIKSDEWSSTTCFQRQPAAAGRIDPLDSVHYSNNAKKNATPRRIQWLAGWLLGISRSRTKLVECPVVASTPRLSVVLYKGTSQCRKRPCFPASHGNRWITGAAENSTCRHEAGNGEREEQAARQHDRQCQTRSSFVIYDRLLQGEEHVNNTDQLISHLGMRLHQAHAPVVPPSALNEHPIHIRPIFWWL